MLTELGFRVRVPVLSLLFSDSLIAVTLRVTWEPAGITTRPELSLMSLATRAVTVSPTLFFAELISAVVEARREVPEARLARDAGVGAGALALGVGAGVLAAVDGLGEAAGRLGRVGLLGCSAGALAVGLSFSSAVVSTGASWRSRLRLSAAAVSPLSPRPQAATAANVSAAIIILDI
jgi:hypothetical protein